LEKSVNIDDLLTTQQIHYPINFISSDGQFIPVSVNISVFERADNPMMGYVIIARDLSVLLKHQAEIEEKNQIILQTNADLEKAHQSLKTILDTIDAIIYILDIDSNELLFVNEYGRLLGKEFLVYPSLMPEKVAMNEIKINSEGNITWEFLHPFNERWYECSYKVIKWSDGIDAGLVKATDITERKQSETELLLAKEQAEESEYMHRFLLENMTNGVIYVKPSGEIVYANKAASAMMSVTSEQLTGKSAFDLKWNATAEDGKPLPVEEIPFSRTIKTGQSVMNFVLRMKAGDSLAGRWVNMNSFPRLSADKTIINLVVVTFEDLTHIRNAEREKLLKEALEKKVALTEESLKFKQKFLANMSHEIRTPLAGILGITEGLSRTELSEKQTEMVEILKVSGESLRGIINDVLDYSKIEAGKIVLNKNIFALKDVFKSTHDLFVNIAKKGIKIQQNISGEIPAYIEADELRISQVLRNFVSNAVKFTEAGNITISAIPVNDQPAPDDGFIKIKVEVADTGIGIPKSKLKELFKPFVQLENEGKKFDGTGLGLSICKEIAFLHGGDSGVESELGVGSTFWFTFKAKAATMIDATIMDKAKKPGSHKNLEILLVEDNLLNQKVFTINLKYIGHNITTADNGLQAIEKFEPGKFDVILMDVQMPLMDGVKATHQLKQRFKDLPPIVGLSANAFEGDREKYMNLGMDEYLTKPLRVEEFMALMEKLF
jgi:PAS domain S-box-containing protein